MDTIEVKITGIKVPSISITYKAKTSEFLDQNLVQKFGEGAAEVLKGYTTSLTDKNNVTEQDVKDTINGRLEGISNDVKRELGISEEVSEASSPTPPPLPPTPPTPPPTPPPLPPPPPPDARTIQQAISHHPVIACARWHDRRYEYIRIVMQRDLWDLMNSDSARFKRTVSSMLKNAGNAIKNGANKVMGTLSTADLYGLSALDGAVKRWMDRSDKIAQQRKEWADQKKAEKENTKPNSDPFLARMNYTGRRGTRNRRGGGGNETSGGNTNGQYQWQQLRFSSGTNTANHLSPLAKFTGDKTIDFGKWKSTKGIQLAELEGSPFDRTKTMMAAVEQKQRNSKNKFYANYYVWKDPASNTMNFGIIGDKTTLGELNGFIQSIRSRRVSESTKITLTLGQLRRLVQETRQFIKPFSL